MTWEEKARKADEEGARFREEWDRAHSDWLPGCISMIVILFLSGSALYCLVSHLVWR